MEVYIKALLQHWKQVLLGGAIIVSTVIVIMGMVKRLFNKVRNKYLRKFLLSFTSVILVLPALAVYFLAEEINFKYFWVGYGISVVATIVTYWFYENTCLRELIGKIGSLTIARLIKFIAKKIVGDTDSEEDFYDFKYETKELEKEVGSVLKENIDKNSLAGTIKNSTRIPISADSKTKDVSINSFKKEEEELKNL